jgi:AcrR family transcriptional regulator
MQGARHAGRPKAAALAQRHAVLLDTAFALFDTHGFHGVSLAAIAEQAHVAVRTIYTGYGGKLGLLGGLIAREHARHAAQLAQLPQGAHRDAHLAALGRHLRERAADPVFLSVQRSVIASADAGLAAACHAAGPGQFTLLLEQALVTGGWRAETAALADLFIAIVAGPQLQRHMPGAAPPCRADFDGRVALFLKAAGEGGAC